MPVSELKDQTRICNKCRKTYLYSEDDLCKECIKKYPYFLSVIEEGFIGGAKDRTGGRVEVYSNKGDEEYAIDEIRFIFKDKPSGSKKGKQFQEFYERWDFQNVTSKELKEVKKIIKMSFMSY